MLRVIIIIDRRPLFRLCIRVSKKGVSDELLETILPDAYARIILPVDTVRILVYWVVQVNIYRVFFFFFLLFKRGKKYIGYDQDSEFCKNYSLRFDKEYYTSWKPVSSMYKTIVLRIIIIILLSYYLIDPS